MANALPTNRTLWAGNLYGTNTANIFAEFVAAEDGALTGKIRIADRNYGLAIYEITGTAGDHVEFRGIPAKVPEGQEESYGEVVGKARLSRDGVLRGEWSSTVGTAGTFDLNPHGSGVDSEVNVSENLLPEQLVTRNTQVGAVRIYRDDIDRLIKKMQADFARGRPVVTFNDGGSEYTKYVDQFLEQVKDSEPLKYLKIQIQEPEAHGINKIAVVELNAYSANEVRVQGIRESWVHGQTEILEKVLRGTESSLVTSYRRFGLTLNQLVLLTLLVVLPEFSGWAQRSIFLIVVVVLYGGITHLHNRYIPTTLIHVGAKPPTLWEKAWPSIGSWIIAVSAAVAGSVSFWLIQKYFGSSAS